MPIRRVGFGQATVPKPPRLTRFGYGGPVLRDGIRHRQVAGWRTGRWDMGSYWHLLNRFNDAWMWRQQQREAYYEWFRKQAAARKQTFQDLRSELNNTRETLNENMLGVQALVAAMQNSEEERLGRGFMALPEDDTLREMVDLGLRDMETARLDAESYEGKSAAKYGTLIRKWLRTQKAGAKLLDHVEKEKAEEASAAAEETQADDER